MDIKFVYKIELLYYQYIHNGFDKKIKDEILLYYVDIEFTQEILELMNEFLINKHIKFLESLEYQAYLLGYNLTHRRRIAKQEHFSVQITFLELDDDDKVIEDKIDDISFFQKYKELFL